MSWKTSASVTPVGRVAQPEKHTRVLRQYNTYQHNNEEIQYDGHGQPLYYLSLGTRSTATWLTLLGRVVSQRLARLRLLRVMICIAPPQLWRSGCGPVAARQHARTASPTLQQVRPHWNAESFHVHVCDKVHTTISYVAAATQRDSNIRTMTACPTSLARSRGVSPLCKCAMD